MRRPHARQVGEDLVQAHTGGGVLQHRRVGDAEQDAIGVRLERVLQLGQAVLECRGAGPGEQRDQVEGRGRGREPCAGSSRRRPTRPASPALGQHGPPAAARVRRGTRSARCAAAGRTGCRQSPRSGRRSAPRRGAQRHGPRDRRRRRAGLERGDRAGRGRGTGRAARHGGYVAVVAPTAREGGRTVEAVAGSAMSVAGRVEGPAVSIVFARWSPEGRTRSSHARPPGEPQRTQRGDGQRSRREQASREAAARRGARPAGRRGSGAGRPACACAARSLGERRHQSGSTARRSTAARSSSHVGSSAANTCRG